jgi:hypothetical protein
LKKGVYILAALALILVFSCQKKKDPPVNPDLGEAYYPTTIGRYIVYDVDSIIFNEFTYDSTFYKYQIKEKIEEAYTDAQGKPALKMARYIKKYSAAKSYTAMPWVIKCVWQVNVTAKDVQVVEENVRFVKLIFPVKQSSIWNGNAWNTNEEWDYIYSYVDIQESINSISFPKTLCVTQKSFRTLISDQYYIEKYAKDVGLVYREIDDLNFDEVVPLTTPILSVAKKKGTIYKSTVNTYGYE